MSEKTCVDYERVYKYCLDDLKDMEVRFCCYIIKTC